MTAPGRDTEHYDLVVLGSGSAAFAGAIRAVELGKRVAMVERATLGGTCVNVGCVPSKTLIRAAESRHRAEHSPFAGIAPTGAAVDFAALIAEKDALVAALRRAKYEDVLRAHPGIDLIRGEGRFVSPAAVRVGDRMVTGDFFLIATGARAWAPPVPGLAGTPYLTSTTLFQLTRLPTSLAVIGGRAIAVECGQMMQRLGSRVTILQRSERLLPDEDPDLTTALTGYLADEGITVETGVTIRRVSHDTVFSITYEAQGESRSLRAEQLLVATGRRPNTAGLGLEAAGVAVDSNGAIRTDAHCRTTVPHIYAAGDVTGKPAYVYTAAHAGRVAVDNCFGAERVRDFSPLPYVVFTDPQVARVGLNERQAAARDIAIDTAKLALDQVPRALAARDTRGFVKLVKEKGGPHLLGASILAPEGGELLMELALAIRYRIPVQELAAMLHPYLTLGEAVKLAAQSFERDVKQLSCCAA